MDAYYGEDFTNRMTQEELFDANNVSKCVWYDGILINYDVDISLGKRQRAKILTSPAQINER